MCGEAALSVCKECPFRRESAPGYLGEMSFQPEAFLAPHWHGGVPLPCHMRTDWDRPLEEQEPPLCRGLLIMMRNAAKIPDNPAVEKARYQVAVSREAFFAAPHEFYQHHGRNEKGVRDAGSQ